jgi:uncharacterized repeat protein (TIGR02543 family)
MKIKQQEVRKKHMTHGQAPLTHTPVPNTGTHNNMKYFSDRCLAHVAGLCALLILCVLTLCPATAQAAKIGTLTVTGGTSGTDYSVSGSKITILTNASLTFSGTSTSYWISISGGRTANLTISSLNLTGPSGPAIKAESGTTLNLTVTGTCTLRAKASGNYAGLYVYGTTTIKGTGTLNAYGSRRSAAIGASWTDGAAAGTSAAGTGYGTITITGSVKVNARAYTAGTVAEGAGIGGAYKSGGGTINITGSARVDATSCNVASGVGWGAGIGSGAAGTGTHTINISTSGLVQAWAANGGSNTGYGAGIGLGDGASGNGVITLAGPGEVATWEGGNGPGYGAGIGGGRNASGAVSVRVTGGTVSAFGSNTSAGYGAGIGSGYNSSGTYTIAISGGSVHARPSVAAIANMGAGIGSGYLSRGATTIAISGGSSTGISSLLYGYGAGIGAGREATGAHTINISGGTAVGYSSYSASATYAAGAGIGTGYGTYTANCTINISGGTVSGRSTTHTTPGYGAGIGSGYAGANGINNTTINISGGTVGAISSSGLGQGAGIGTSYYNVGTSNVTISGGTVTAYSGGSGSYYGDGAGIGSGYLSRSNNGAVTITGGTVNARSASSQTYAAGAAIGSGNSGILKSVTITGGTITCAYVNQAAGIGAGKGGSCTSVVIDGGSFLSVSGVSTVPVISPAAKNSSGTALTYFPASVQRNGAAVANTLITSGDLAGITLASTPKGNAIYGIRDVRTDASGNLGLFIVKSAMTAGNRGYLVPSGQTALVSTSALSSASSARFSSAEALCTVTFNAQGGTPTPPSVSNVVIGNKIARPVTPSSGQSFVGWSTSSANTSPVWDFSSDVVGGTMTLYALWGTQVTATFNAAGGSPTPRIQTLVSGAFLPRPTSPVRTGYDFAGWVDTVTGKAFDFNTPLTSSVTLRATWTPKSPSGGKQGTTTAIPAPAFNLTPCSTTSIKVSWTSSAASGFELQYRKRKTSKWTALALPASARSRTLTKLKTAQYYQVAIRSFKITSGQKIYSSWSAVRSLRVTPPAPTGLKSKVVSAKSIRLSWTKVSGATQYRIYRKTPGGKWKLAKTVKARKSTTNKYTLKNIIKKSGRYSFRIKSVRKIRKKYTCVSPYSKVLTKQLKIFR